RFEVFCKVIVLENVYFELIDKKEQSYRFVNDLVTRKQQQNALLDIDTKLLDCLQNITECTVDALVFVSRHICLYVII
ncbi:hypothetical protein NAI02_12290, partial [Francisella tularensis subsp. holarctica]|nr:hypothetical protein [Francisella tularensis subsp. holarctica]